MQNNIILLQHENNHLKNRDIDKAGRVHVFFASALNTDYGLWVSHCPELEGLDCKHEKLPGNSKLVWNLLLHLDPARIHLRIAKELTDVMGKPLLVICESS